MEKNIFAGTFLEEAQNYKGPLRRVPKDHFPKLINEETINFMTECEKRLFTIAMFKLDDIKNLRNSVRHRKSKIPKFIKNEDLTTAWHRKATDDEKEELKELRVDFKCIQGTLFHLIKSRIPILPEEFILVLRPGYKIVVGLLEKNDPLITQPCKDSTFSIPLYLLGTKVFN